MSRFSRWRVRGEYGPCAYDYLVWYGNAKTKENAIGRAIREFKKTAHWPRIGMSNIYIEEVK